MMIIKLRNFR